MPYYIYTLSHPITDTLVYVGITANLRQRYRSHIGNQANSAKKKAWMHDLKKDDLAPSVKVIETMQTEQEARDRECYWIRHYLDNGVELFNVQCIQSPIEKTEHVKRDSDRQIERKYHFHEFRSLFIQKIKSRGYRSVRAFSTSRDLPYNALSRAVNGTAHPSPASLNKWCDALNCTPQERQEIMHAAGYHLSPDELDEEEAA